MYALRLAISGDKQMPTDGQQHYMHHTSRGANWKITSGTRDAKTWATREAAQRNADRNTYFPHQAWQVVEVDPADLSVWQDAVHVKPADVVRVDGQWREVDTAAIHRDETTEGVRLAFVGGGDLLLDLYGYAEVRA